MSIKLMIWDFDGTILDTKKAIVFAKQETMRQLGLPVADERACADTIGLSSRIGFGLMYPELSEEMLDKCVVNYRANFDKSKFEIPPTLFTGVVEVLGELKEKGMILTIATSRNRKSLIDFLERFGLKDYFSYLLAAEDTERLKPNPDPVLRTMNDLGMGVSETIVIGDMPYDILMGKNAGVRTVGVTYGNASREKLEEAGADLIIDTIEELTEKTARLE
ncbi:MAG: HAD family hydrolase [Lachnospiraceae bacterium]|nr:HAD family hydrolase [Lachnospiraceae bacterium]